MKEIGHFLKYTIISTIAILFTWCLFTYAGFTKSNEFTVLNEGWNVTLHGKTTRNVTLTDFHIQDFVRGDTIILETVIPPELDSDYTIHPLVWLCVIEAYVDDQMIFSYGRENYEKNKFVGSGVFSIELPDHAAGKVLKIKLTANEDYPVTTFIPIRCTRNNNFFSIFFRNELIFIFISFTLISVGILMSVFGLILVFRTGNFYRMLFIGLFSLLMGLWTMCFNRISQFVTGEYYYSTLIEYFSLFLAPIPFALLVLSCCRNQKEWRINMLKWNVFVFTFCDIVFFILHALNVARLPKTLSIFHMLCAVCIVLIIIPGFVGIKIVKKSEKLMRLSLIILSISLMLDLIRFNLDKYIFPSENTAVSSFLPVGIFLVVMVFCLSYVAHIQEVLFQISGTKALEKLAYTDSLTGLYNRTKFNNDSSLLKNSVNYALVSFDIDGLKFVNDNFGHEEGDELLRCFSAALKEQVVPFADCYRIGGDEFVAMFKIPEIDRVEETMANLTAALGRCSENHPYKVSCSFGIARKSEVSGEQVQKVYALADERMYSMKLANRKTR